MRVRLARIQVQVFKNKIGQRRNIITNILQVKLITHLVLGGDPGSGKLTLSSIIRRAEIGLLEVNPVTLTGLFSRLFNTPLFPDTLHCRWMDINT